MYIAFYWWGFRLWVEDGVVHEFITAAEQGRTGIESFLRRKASEPGLWWLSPVAPLVSGTITEAVMRVGVPALRSADTTCGHRGCTYTIPWAIGNSYTACR